MAASVPTITLYDGIKMPVLGLGTAMETITPTPEENEAFVTAFKSALDLGYRHFDTAAHYNSEKALGSAIVAKVQDGTVKREELFITTKLWPEDMYPGKVLPALKQSLEKLQLDYVDNYLIHWPVALVPGSSLVPGNVQVDDKVSHIAIWKEMEECKKQGLARTIGVSNFNMQQLKNILDQCEIKPSNDQTELHVYLQSKKFVAFCKEHNIAVVCYSPLARQKPENGLDIGSDPILTALAKKHGCTNQQVALRFLVQEGLVVIPKSANPQRQQQNISIFNCEIPEDDMNTLRQLDRNKRIASAEEYISHAKEYPFHEEF